MSTNPDISRLETDRLVIRPFVPDDLDSIHPILNAAFGAETRAARQEWLDWTVMNYTEYDNDRSVAVMRRLGMSVKRNPESTPARSQIVGILNYPAASQGPA